MATLSGNKIKDTYQSLVKFSDNGNITTSAKQLTDGFGNNSPMFVSTTQVGIGVTPESGLNLHVFGDAKIGSNLTVIGNLVVEGSTTTVGTDTLTVKDPLIVLANNNTSTDAVDIGFYGKYTPSGTTLYSGLFREALTGKYRLFKGLEVEPTTTVNTSGTGYAVASLIANLEGNVTGNLIGSVTGGTFSGTLLSNVVATTQSAGDNSTKVATTAYVDNQVGLYDTLSEVLANGNTSGANDIIIEDSQKVNYGTDSDLQIYHDGSNGFIKNTTGQLNITDSIIALRNQADNENMLYARENAQVELYYDNSIKLATTNTGITVTGDVDFTGNINIGDNQKILFGDSGDIEMFFNGSTFVIDDTVEVFGFDIDTNLIRFRGTDLYTEISNGQHTFWTNGTERFKINATEVKVSHQLNVTGDLIVDTDTLFVDVSEDSVGINTSNPSSYSKHELVITAPDEGGVTIASATDEAAYLDFSDGSGLKNFIRVDHDGDVFGYNSWGSHFFSIGEGVPAMTINSSGITIHDELISSSYATIQSHINIDATVAGDPYISFQQNGTQRASISYDDTEEAFRISTDEFFIKTGSPRVKALTIDSSQNVGIGTDDPQSKLQVTTTGYDTGTTGFRLTHAEETNYVGYARLQTPSGDPIFSLGTIDGATTYETLSMKNGNSTFAGSVTVNGGQDALTINTTDTDGPYAVWKNTTNAALGYVGNANSLAAAGNTNFAVRAITDLIFAAGVGTERMRIDSSGNSTFAGSVTTETGINLESGVLVIKNATSDSNGLRLFQDSSDASKIYNNYNGTLQLGVNNTTSLTLSSSQNSTFAGNVTASAFLTSNGSLTPSGFWGTTINAGSGSYADFALLNSATAGIMYNPTGTLNMVFQGKVGIGTNSPQQLLHISNTSGDFGAEAVLRGSTSTGTPKSEIAFKRGSSGDGAEMVLRTSNSSGTIQDVMTLDTSGNVGITGGYASSQTFQSTGSLRVSSNSTTTSGNVALELMNDATGTRYLATFTNLNGIVGSISTYSSSTSYNTSSDYRLKENVVEMTGALDRVSQLKPSRFNFIADADKTVDGFLAHEVQEIVPEAITGEKDGMRDEEYEVSPDVYEDVVHPAEEAVYETIEHPAVEEELDDEGNVIVEGKEAYTEEVLVTEAKEEWTEKVLVSEKVMGTREVPDYQGIDQSKLVPLLVGAIQELKAEIESLKSQINN